MIRGVGVDGVAIARMQKSLERPHFAQRVFGEAERAWFEGKAKGQQAASAAACFAAKEAFLKAAGTGLGGFSLADITVHHRESGEPYYVFTGSALAYVQREGLVAHLSLTHEGGLAIAFAVLERTAPAGLAGEAAEAE